MSKQTVEDFLIEPLARHFEDDQPTNGIRSVLINDHDGASQQQLTAAVEFLKRNILSKKSFPAPKKISEAMKAVQFSTNTKMSAGQITAENLCARQVEFAKMNKAKICSIEKRTIEWNWWQDYYRNHIGNFYIADLMDQYTIWSVVTRHPSEFDPSYSSTSIRKGEAA